MRAPSLRLDVGCSSSRPCEGLGRCFPRPILGRDWCPLASLGGGGAARTAPTTASSAATNCEATATLAVGSSRRSPSCVADDKADPAWSSNLSVVSGTTRGWARGRPHATGGKVKRVVASWPNREESGKARASMQATSKGAALLGVSTTTTGGALCRGVQEATSDVRTAMAARARLALAERCRGKWYPPRRGWLKLRARVASGSSLGGCGVSFADGGGSSGDARGSDGTGGALLRGFRR